MSGNISKFHGEYLKCIVTKYASVTEYLGNSGSLIILQETKQRTEDEELHRNYIYLGDEFLASGYGYATKAEREIAERIVRDYDADKQMLMDRDNKLRSDLELQIFNIENRLNSFIDKNGGSIDETIVTVVDKDGNEKKINVRNLLFSGQEASYDNLEILSIDKYVNGVKAIGDEVFLPVGSYIEEIKVVINYKKNDSGGIDMFEAHHNALYGDDTEDEVLIQYDRIMSQENKGFGSITYRKLINNGRIIDRYIPNIMEDVRIYILETQPENYKMYPLLEKNYNIQIPSIANKVNNNVKILPTRISIRPQFTLWYAKDDYNFNAFDESFPLNSFRDYDVTKVCIHDVATTKKLYIAVPEYFVISRIHVLNSEYERFNWTGAFVVKDNIGIFAHKNPGKLDSRLINSNVYMIDLSGMMFEDLNSMIEVEVLYKYPKKENDKDYDTDSTMPYINLVPETPNIVPYDNPVIVMNEDFNNMYWVNSYMMGSLINSGYTDLNDRLDKIKENGARHM